jgi:hypothetical protein
VKYEYFRSPIGEGGLIQLRWIILVSVLCLAVLAEPVSADEAEELIQELQDENSTVRAEAAEALGAVYDPRAVDPLIFAVRHDEDSTVREKAAETLAIYIKYATKGGTAFPPGLIERHLLYIKSINFTWLKEAPSVEEQTKLGDVGGGNFSTFVDALEEDGFVVQAGALEYIPIFDLVNRGVLFSCNGNNPVTPYKAYILPPAPGQVDPNPFSDVHNMSVVYRLRPDEALVYIGKTPPECTYFGYQSFQFYHQYPGEDVFRKTFANVGDSLNHLTVNVEGGNERSPFDQAVVIVTTADRGVNQRVCEAARSSGYSQEIVNSEVLPSPILAMGLGPEADVFTVLNRISLFKDPEKGREYMNETPGVVLRITPRVPAELDPYPVPELRVRGTGNASELNLMGALNDLRSAILDQYDQGNATELATGVWITEGYDGIQRGVNVLGPTRDAAYLNTSTFTLGDDPGEFLIVYGINHAASGKAIYTNLAVYGLKLLNGVVSADDSKLVGTAEEYLPGRPEAKYLYAVKVARNCSGEENCLAVPIGNDTYGIGLDQEAFIAFRAYVEEETMVGPSYTELVYDRAIKFSP